MKVVAWYLPTLVDQGKDQRRALGAIRFRTPLGQSFDGFALDIESPAVHTVSIRNARLLAVSALPAAVGAVRREAGRDHPGAARHAAVADLLAELPVRRPGVDLRRVRPDGLLHEPGQRRARRVPTARGRAPRTSTTTPPDRQATSVPRTARRSAPGEAGGGTRQTSTGPRASAARGTAGRQPARDSRRFRRAVGRGPASGAAPRPRVPAPGPPAGPGTAGWCAACGAPSRTARARKRRTARSPTGAAVPPAPAPGPAGCRTRPAGLPPIAARSLAPGWPVPPRLPRAGQNAPPRR